MMKELDMLVLLAANAPKDIWDTFQPEFDEPAPVEYTLYGPCPDDKRGIVDWFHLKALCKSDYLDSLESWISKKESHRKKLWPEFYAREMLRMLKGDE